MLPTIAEKRLWKDRALTDLYALHRNRVKQCPADIIYTL